MIASLDAFFTPAPVAEKLVRYVRRSSPVLVLDPAAGDGALLKAAGVQWPKSRIAALDCDPARIASLSQNADWECDTCDFLNSHSRESSRLLGESYQAADVILLNPPYSGRGNARWQSNVRGSPVAVGRAMAFLLTAFDLLAEDGEMAVLLPSSAITSQRDSAAWDLISERAEVSIIDSFPRGTFSHGTAVTVGVHIDKACPGSPIRQAPATECSANTRRVRLIRGTVPVHAAKLAGLGMSDEMPTGVPFVHTTDVRGDEVRPDLRRLPTGRFVAQTLGPSVLIPRVGKPLLDKIGVWKGGPAVLSDCLFALETRSLRTAELIKTRLRNNFGAFSYAYCGSCAQYLTISALVRLLHELGITAQWDGPARWAVSTPHRSGAAS